MITGVPVAKIILAVILVQELRFHKNILALLSRSSLNSRNPAHLRYHKTVFIVMGFVNHKAVKA